MARATNVDAPPTDPLRLCLLEPGAGRGALPADSTLRQEIATLTSYVRLAHLQLGEDPGPHPHLALDDLALPLRAFLGSALLAAWDADAEKPARSRQGEVTVYQKVLAGFGVDCWHGARAVVTVAGEPEMTVCLRCGTLIGPARPMGCVSLARLMRAREDD